MEVGLIIFFLVLSVLTVLRIIKRCDPIFQKFPTLMQVVPSWSFFAPVPNMHDYHFLYRCFSAEGKVEQWVEVFKPMDTRPLHSFIWNPSKRFHKGFLDIAHDLLRFSSKFDDRAQVCLSLPYLHILSYVSGLDRIKGKGVQFVILTNSRLKDYEVAFLSEVHPLEGEKDD